MYGVLVVMMRAQSIFVVGGTVVNADVSSKADVFIKDGKIL